MATHSSKITLRAKWRRGWELMWAGKTTEGCDLLSGITVADLPMVANADEPEKLLAKIEAIIARRPGSERAARVRRLVGTVGMAGRCTGSYPDGLAGWRAVRSWLLPAGLHSLSASPAPR
jgi:hypothetical protein